MLLEATLSADYTPGTNRNAEVACADWRFLLPNLSIEEVVCVGYPSESTLAVLSQHASRIVIVEDHAKDRSTSGSSIDIGWSTEAQLGQGTASLLLLSDARAIERFRRESEYRRRLWNCTAHDGVMCIELSMWQLLRFPDRRLANDFRELGAGTVQRFWVTRKAGEVRTAVPVHDPKISSYFFRNLLYGMSRTKRFLSSGGRLASRVGLIDYLNQGSVVIASREPNSNAYSPPAFLQRLATSGGISLAAHRFGLAARGTYNSNKIVFHLFEPDTADADVIVKMTRVAEFNDRLEHEWEVLSSVKAKGLVPAGTYPEPLFFGYHSGLAALGERAVNGRPFRMATSAKPDCAVASSALAWITLLGQKSAIQARPLDVAERVRALFQIYATTYRIDENESRFLLQQIQSIADQTDPIPVVFTHGDAGAWNVVVDSEDRALFLDWEAADRQGLPLWDLFYFFRSFGNWVQRAESGERNTETTFKGTFLQPGLLNDRLASAIEHYCSAVGLNRSLVRPLYYTCWMHRALRQATWADSLTDAHFARVLRHSIGAQDGLTALFK